MPKAPMNKNNFLQAWENQVWATWQSGAMKPIAISHRVHETPHYQLWLGILIANAAHTFASLRRGQCVHKPLMRVSRSACARQLSLLKGTPKGHCFASGANMAADRP